MAEVAKTVQAPAPAPGGATLARRALVGLVVPTLAVVTALVLGGVVIWLTSGGFGAPAEATQKTLAAYQGLLDGAFFNERGFSETIVATTPYILAGLSVAFAFKGGLFNIGAEGQYFLGAVSAAWVGYALPLPPVLHLLVALLAGFIGGGLWGAIPGYLKARTGAHEVIVTIMLNYIAFLLVDWLVNGPLRAPRSTAPKTPDILATAMLPRFFAAPDRLHSGILVALFAVALIWWFLNKTTLGFEIRTVGANRDAARYAGINVTRIFVLSMGVAGGLAGLAGGVEVLGLQHNLPAFFSAGYGFDSIAIALLARNNPLGIVPAAFLFGALRNGADLMELRSGASKQIISVVQALMLLFVAAPAIIRALYRLRTPKDTVKEAPLSRGWGG